MKKHSSWVKVESAQTRTLVKQDLDKIIEVRAERWKIRDKRDN